MATRLFLLIPFLILSCSRLFGQTEDEKIILTQSLNIPALQRIAFNAQMEKEENYNRALAFAKIYKWPLKYITQDSSLATLIGISKNFQPIYSRDLGAGGNITIASPPVYLAGGLGLNIEGQGMLGGMWESDAPNFFPLMTHDFFQSSGSSRISLGPDVPIESNTNASGHATAVASVLIANKNSGINGLYAGTAPQASLYALTDSNCLQELATLVQPPTNLLFANHSWEPVPNCDNIIFNAPHLTNVIANGNLYQNPGVDSNFNSIFVGKCREINSSTPAHLISNEFWVKKSTSPPVAITDNSVGFMPITFASSLPPDTISSNSITPMEIYLNIIHPHVSDLRLFLVGPNACGSMELSINNGGSGADYIHTQMATTAVENISNAVAPFSDKYYRTQGSPLVAPSNLPPMYSMIPLTPLAGCPYIGTWKLYVGDDVLNSLEGFIQDWRIDISGYIFQAPNFIIKPDLVAQSYFVQSGNAASNSAAATNFQNATSFSSPAVTGGAMLLQQLYRDYNPTFMRSATVKALMCHTAKEASFDGPDYKFGYGVLDVEKAAKLIINNQVKSSIIEENLFNNTSYSIQVTAGNEPLVASLAWLSEFGIFTLNKDLDLRVTSLSGTEFPWGIDSSNPFGPAIKNDNSRDNYEKVQIMNPVFGQTYTITVSHKGFLNTPWPFSLIISGIYDCSNNPNTMNVISDVLSNNVSLLYATDVITANNSIYTDATAKYVAGEEVVMLPDFDAIIGSKYDALIGDCNQSIINRNNMYNPVNREIITFNNHHMEGLKKHINNPPVIYPNPNNGEFYFDPKDKGIIEIQILTSTGTIIYQNTITNNTKKKVTLSDVSNGIYFIIAKTEKGIFTDKFEIR